MDAVDFPQALQFLVQSGLEKSRADFELHRRGPRLGAARVCRRDAGELVPATRHCARQRGGCGRQERGGRISRRTPPPAPMDAPHHGLCRAFDRGTRRPRLAGGNQTSPEKLDRPQRGGVGEIPRGKNRHGNRGFHHSAGHAFRRDLHDSRARAFARLRDHHGRAKRGRRKIPPLRGLEKRPRPHRTQ